MDDFSVNTNVCVQHLTTLVTSTISILIVNGKHNFCKENGILYTVKAMLNEELRHKIHSKSRCYSNFCLFTNKPNEHRTTIADIINKPFEGLNTHAHIRIFV